MSDGVTRLEVEALLREMVATMTGRVETLEQTLLRQFERDHAKTDARVSVMAQAMAELTKLAGRNEARSKQAHERIDDVAGALTEEVQARKDGDEAFEQWLDVQAAEAKGRTQAVRRTMVLLSVVGTVTGILVSLSSLGLIGG